LDALLRGMEEEHLSIITEKLRLLEGL